MSSLPPQVRAASRLSLGTLCALVLASPVAAEAKPPPEPGETLITCPTPATKEEAWSSGKSLAASIDDPHLLQAAVCFAFDLNDSNNAAALTDLYVRHPRLPLLRELSDFLFSQCERRPESGLCEVIAASYATGNGVGPDADRARKAYALACSSGRRPTCSTLIDYSKTLGKITAEEHDLLRACLWDAHSDMCASLSAHAKTLTDVTHVNDLLRWGCTPRETLLCGAYADWLAARGETKAALSVHVFACSVDSANCAALLDASPPATTVEANALRRDLFRRYCKSADTTEPACLHESQRWDGVIRQAEAQQKECLDGVAAACTLAGLIRISVDDQTVRASPWFLRACDGGDGAGCYELGRIRENHGDPDRAEHFLQQACDKSYGPACGGLVELLRLSKPEHSDSSGQLGALVLRACVLGDPGQCGAIYGGGDDPWDFVQPRKAP